VTDADRLLLLFRELLSNVGYAEGRRRFPRTLTADDAVALTAVSHEEIEQGTAGRAERARLRKLEIACEPGCCWCCEQPVTVYLPEALRIARWLSRDENVAARGLFLGAYPGWRARAGDGFDALTAAIAAGDSTAEKDAHLAQWRRRVMCAFTDQGLCTLYEVRPAVCRHCHALETSDRCRADSDAGLPSAMTYSALDEALQRGRTLALAMHHALGGARRTPSALCQAVYDLLTQAA
jgi:Fe-S-cluster containining protein